MTAKHIDDSLTLALAEGSYYGTVENIASHKVSGDSVQTHCHSLDALFANLMTFPIAKWVAAAISAQDGTVWHPRGRTACPFGTAIFPIGGSNRASAASK